MTTILSIGTIIDNSHPIAWHDPQKIYLNNNEAVAIPSFFIHGKSLDDSENQVIEMIKRYFNELRKENAAV